MSQVHVKFLSNIQKDFYLLISEVDDSLLPPTTPLPHHLNLIKEKDIYMRAALQLLDQKNLVPSALEQAGVTPGNQNQTFGGNHEVPSSSTKSLGQDDNYMHDVIRLGYLKKGARGGSMNIPGSGSHWKRKYVEVRHGLFSYDDYHGGTIYIGNSDLEELTRGDNYHRRSIKLNVDTCRCRMLPAKDGNSSESRVFEIVDNVKRLWMASSVEECREWVKAINSAMVGSTYQGIAHPRTANVRSYRLNQDVFQRISAKSDPSDVVYNSNFGHGSQDISKIPIERNCSEDLIDSQHHHHDPYPLPLSSIAHWSSIDGAAAPYVSDMSTFLQLQDAFLSCGEENSYRSILYSLYQNRVKLTIPVLFIKSKTTHSHFMLSAQDTLSTQNIRSKCTSQVWKDLQRDIIVVNGEQISGELGAESMLGALVRHLHDKAEALRVLQSKQPGSEQGTGRGKYLGDHVTPSQKNYHPFAINTSNPSNNNNNHNTNANSSSGNNNNSQASNSIKSLTSVDFAISEAQIVECAKDLLVLCNRTQSGGDTYFCIEAFLSGDHMKEFCILTPYSAEAEPLEFQIDVVEVSQHLSAALRQNRSHTHPIQTSTEQHTHLHDVPSSMLRNECEGITSSIHKPQPSSTVSNDSHLGETSSGGTGGNAMENSFLEVEGLNAPASSTVNRVLSSQLQPRHDSNADKVNLLQHHMHTPPSTTGALKPDPVTPKQSNSFYIRNMIAIRAPSTGDFHGLSSSTPPPNVPDSQIAEAPRIRKKSFTFEDVLLETDRRHQLNQGKRLLDEGEEEDDCVKEADDEEDETRQYLAAARSSHSKRTGLRLSGSGPVGFLVNKSDEAMVKNNPPSPHLPPKDPSRTQHEIKLVSSSGAAVGSGSSSGHHQLQNSGSLSRSAGGPPPPPRRAQLDLKRELEQEGYLNSVWHSDGTSVKLHSSLLSQQSQPGHLRHEQPLPPVPTSKSISPHTTSRPSSFPRQGGVAMAYLDISQDAFQPVNEEGVESDSPASLSLPVATDTTLKGKSESHELGHHSDATIVSGTSSALTQVHVSRPDDVSVISELTFDTFLRNQKHHEFGHGESHHTIPLYPHHLPIHGSHLPPHPHLQQQQQLQLLQHPHNHQSDRPMSSGQTTTSGQMSPGTISQRTSGQHDAITTTTTSSTPTFPLATSNRDQVTAAATALLAASQQYKSSSLNHSSAPFTHQTNYAVISDGEEYGILDDDGHDSTHSNPLHSTNGPASGSKKKSLLNRIGKKLRPFKMPPLSSSNTDHHTSNATALDAMRSPFNGNNAGTRSRSQSGAATPVGPTTTTHFQHFLQQFTPRNHNQHSNASGNNSLNPYHHHHHHHHHDSDRESSTSKCHNQKTHRHHLHVNLNGNIGGSHSALSSGQNPHFPFQHQPTSLLSSIDSNNGQDPSLPPVRYGLRIQVRARCRYRVCGANPTGFVDVDSWATVLGVFQQSFLLVGDGRSQLGITDRLVTIEIDGCSSPHNSPSLSASVDNTVYFAPGSHYPPVSFEHTPSHRDLMNK